MIYGIILVIVYVTCCVYATWIGRNQQSYAEWHYNRHLAVEKESKVLYYTAYAIGNIINYSVLGYLIYSLTCI